MNRNDSKGDTRCCLLGRRDGYWCCYVKDYEWDRGGYRMIVNKRENIKCKRFKPTLSSMKGLVSSLARKKAKKFEKV